MLKGDRIGLTWTSVGVSVRPKEGEEDKKKRRLISMSGGGSLHTLFPLTSPLEPSLTCPMWGGVPFWDVEEGARPTSTNEEAPFFHTLQ